mgnify:FL=1
MVSSKLDLLYLFCFSETSFTNVSVTVYQAYNILSLLTLYDDLGFREKRMEQYTQGLSKRMTLFQSGKVDLNVLVDKLTEYGIYIQDVN